jgi:hypothetical protein
MHIETAFINRLSTAIHTPRTVENTPNLPGTTPNYIVDNTQKDNALLWKN